MNSKTLPIRLQIDDSFFEEEVRNDYLVSTEMKKIWAVELDLLNEFMNVCRKYNIEYHTIGGTLLGAARHKGFIPWDDDIDVQMFRKDYEKLLSVADKAFSHPYFLQTEYSDPGYSKGFAKLRNSETSAIPINDVHCNLKYNQGIFIDIFPLDNIPDDLNEREKFLKDLNRENKGMRRFFRLTYGNKEETKHSNPAFKLFKKTFGNCFKAFFDITKIKNPYVKRFDKVAVRYDNDKTKQCAIPVLYTFNRFSWDCEDLYPYVELPFEMLTVRCPHNYERVLDVMYGDWHKMVKGAAVHLETLFDPEVPYMQNPNR